MPFDSHSAPAANSTVSPALPRRDAALCALIAFAFAGVVLALPTVSVLVQAAGALCLLAGLALLVAVVAPERCRQGVRVGEDGFEYLAPLRKARFIRFDEIEAVKALCLGEGSMGNDVPFLVYTAAGKVTVRESCLYGTDLLRRFSSLAGFDNRAYSAALRHQPRGLESLLGKRFLVYRKDAREVELPHRVGRQ